MSTPGELERGVVGKTATALTWTSRADNSDRMTQVHVRSSSGPQDGRRIENLPQQHRIIGPGRTQVSSAASRCSSKLIASRLPRLHTGYLSRDARTDSPDLLKITLSGAKYCRCRSEFGYQRPDARRTQAGNHRQGDHRMLLTSGESQCDFGSRSSRDDCTRCHSVRFSASMPAPLTALIGSASTSGGSESISSST